MRDGEHLPLDEWLLDDHLDQLSEADRFRLYQLMRDDPELAARHRRLQRVLEPLDAWSAAAPSDGLVSRILDRIAAEKDTATVIRDPAFPRMEHAQQSGRFSGRPRVSLRDLVAVAAVIAFFFGVLVPSMSAVRERSRRVACIANLGQIGRGLAAYGLVNNNALPSYRPASPTYRTSFLPTSNASAKPSLKYAPNRRSPFLLVRLHFVPNARVFTCPSQGQPIPLHEPEPGSVEEWVKRERCSYDSLNMAGPVPRFSYASSQPYMADKNPLFVGGRFNRIEPAVTNSPNHRNSAGQNVLYLDGSAHWRVTPNCGLRGDNIWQAGQLVHYRGTEVQRSTDDTFLVP